MMKRVVLLIIMSLLIFSMPSVNAQDGVVLIVPQRDTPKSLNPNWQVDVGAYSSTSNIFSHLVVLDWGVTEGVSAYGDLARDWTISEDGTVYTFNLYEDILWHDGQPVTSADVKYTFDTIIENGYPLAAALVDVVDIRAPDELTVEIELGQAVSSFVPTLAQASNWYGKILPKHIYEGSDWATSPANDNPIGSGPFRFVEWDPNSYVIVTANEDYFRGRPLVDTIVFQHIPDTNVAVSLYQAGEFPYLPSEYVPSFGEINQMMNSGQSDTIVTTPSIYGRNVYFNMEHEILGKREVREAIAYAIDRDSINQLAFFSLWPTIDNAGIPVLGEYLNTDAKFPEFDAAVAEQMLDEAGYPRGADGWRFSIDVTSPTIADLEAIAEVFVEQLRNIGIDARWQRYDSATWNERARSGAFDITMYFVRYGPDPEAFGEHFQTGGARNFMRYTNPRVDELIEAGKYETNAEERIAIYKEIQQILVDDLASINMFQQVRFSFVNPEWSGFPVQPEAFGRSISWFGYYSVVPPGQ